MSDFYSWQDHKFRGADPYAAAKYRWTLRILRKHMVGPSMLNVGCGAGDFSALAEDHGFTVVGVEPDEAAFHLAQSRMPKSQLILNCSLSELKLERMFDVVVVHDVLEHIENDENAIERITSFLKPGGYIVGSVPAIPFLFGWHDEQLKHYRRYTRSGIIGLLEEKTSIEITRYFGIFSLPIVALYSKVLKRGYPNAANSGAQSFRFRLFGLICLLESRIPSPIGTSLLFFSRKLSD